MDAIDSVFDPLREFAKDSVRLVKRCHKPDRKGNPTKNKKKREKRTLLISQALNFRSDLIRLYLEILEFCVF
jgi:hypothetical protein